jgi:hypothetical protein
MSLTPLTEITVRIPLDRPFTERDYRAGVGIEFLEQRLFQVGWVDEAGMILKRFKVSFNGYRDHGENYIEWKAELKI